MTLAAGFRSADSCLHVLPGGFHRIRHYGLLANAGRQENLVRRSCSTCQGQSRSTMRQGSRPCRLSSVGAVALPCVVEIMLRQPVCPSTAMSCRRLFSVTTHSHRLPGSPVPRAALLLLNAISPIFAASGT